MSADLVGDQPLDGDLEAEYGQLIEIYWPKLVALCKAWQRSDAAAEDIVAEAFMRLHERRDHIRNKGAYLTTIVSNLLKRRTREYPVAEPADGGSDLGALTELEDYELVRQALSQLPRQQRAVFELHLTGHTTEEIAHVLRMNLATVRSHKRHACDKLQKWWSAGWKERR